MQTRLTEFVARSLALALLLAPTLAIPRAAQAAGIGDKTLPLLPGATKAKLVYTVPYVRSSGSTETSFSCTSTEPAGGADVIVGIEVFDSGILRNDVTLGQGIMTLTPGDTDVISTQDTAALLDDTFTVAVNVGAGSARILATSSKVICTALFLDAANAVPTFATTIPIMKKLKQGGE